MSYYATCDGYIDFVDVLNEETCEKAYLALRDVFDIDVGEYKDLDGKASTSFSVWNSEAGYRAYEVHEALNAVKSIAQIQKGSIKYNGEDGCIWRIVFEDGEWQEENGVVVFDEKDLEDLADEMGYKLVKKEPEKENTTMRSENYLAHGTGGLCFGSILDEETYTKVQKMLGKHFDTCSVREHYPNGDEVPAVSQFDFWTGPDDEEYNEKSVLDTLNAIVEVGSPITYAYVYYTGIEDDQKWHFIYRDGKWVKEDTCKKD